MKNGAICCVLVYILIGCGLKKIPIFYIKYKDQSYKLGMNFEKFGKHVTIDAFQWIFEKILQKIGHVHRKIILLLYSYTHVKVIWGHTIWL